MSQYIKIGKTDFKEELNNVKKMIKNPATQEEVDKALENLKGAYSRLQLNKKDK